MSGEAERVADALRTRPEGLGFGARVSTLVASISSMVVGTSASKISFRAPSAAENDASSRAANRRGLSHIQRRLTPVGTRCRCQRGGCRASSRERSPRAEPVAGADRVDEIRSVMMSMRRSAAPIGNQTLFRAIRTWARLAPCRITKERMGRVRLRAIQNRRKP